MGVARWVSSKGCCHCSAKTAAGTEDGAAISDDALSAAFDSERARSSNKIVVWSQTYAAGWPWWCKQRRWLSTGDHRGYLYERLVHNVDCRTTLECRSSTRTGWLMNYLVWRIVLSTTVSQHASWYNIYSEIAARSCTSYMTWWYTTGLWHTSASHPTRGYS